jgi:hypothetical protein
VTAGVLSDITPEVARLSGVRILDKADQVGGWEQFENPNGVVEILATPEGALRAAQVFGRVLEQSEVWAQRRAPKSRANATGVDIESPSGYNFGRRSDVLRFWRSALGQEPGLGASVVRAADGTPILRVIAEDAATVERTRTALDRWGKENNLDVSATPNPVEVQKSVNDWRRYPDGRSHLEEAFGVDRGAVDGLARRAKESLRNRVEALEAAEAIPVPEGAPGAPRRPVAAPTEAPRPPPEAPPIEAPPAAAAAPPTPVLRPRYAIEGAPDVRPESSSPPFPGGPTEIPWTRPAPGDRPRVETAVQNIQEAIAEQRALGIPTKDLVLDRDTRRSWRSIEPKVQDHLRDPRFPDRFIERVRRKQLSRDDEVHAFDSVVKARQEQKELTRLEYRGLKDLREAAEKDPGYTKEDLAEIQKFETEAWRAHQESLASYLPAAAAQRNDLTAIARALASAAAIRKASTLGPDQKFLRDLMRIAGKSKISEKEFQRLYEMYEKGDPMLSDALASHMTGRWSKFTTLLRSFLLTFSSEIVNVTGNMGVNAQNIGERATAAGIDSLWSGITGRSRHRTMRQLGVEVQTMGHELMPAVRDFLHERLVNVHRRAWTGEGRPFRPDLPLEYQVSKFPGKGMSARVARMLATTLDGMIAGDDLFQRVTSKGILARRSMELAEQRLGPKAKSAALESEMRLIMADAIMKPEKYPDLHQKVSSEVNRRLFRDKPWEMTSGIEGWVKRWPWLAVIMPFVRTPSNIARYGIHHSPLGFFTPDLWNKYAAHRRGELSRGDFLDAFAPRLFGTLTFYAFYEAAKQGLLTGGGPVNYNEKSAKMETGWRPYSFKFTFDGQDYYLPFTRFDPISQMMGVAADLSEAPDIRSESDMVSKVVSSIQSNFTDRVYVQSLMEATEAASDPQRYLSQFAANRVSMGVPRIVGRLAAAIDPVVRDPRPLDRGPIGWGKRISNTVQRQLPLASTRLPPRRGPTGEEIIRPGTAVGRFLAPVQVSPARPGRDLEALMAEIGYAPSRSRNTMRISGKVISLSREDVDFMARADRSAAFELRRIIRSPSFLRLPDSIEEGGPRSKEAIIRNTYQRHRDGARQQLLARSSFRARARAQIAEQRRAG